MGMGAETAGTVTIPMQLYFQLCMPCPVYFTTSFGVSSYILVCLSIIVIVACSQRTGCCAVLGTSTPWFLRDAVA